MRYEYYFRGAVERVAPALIERLEADMADEGEDRAAAAYARRFGGRASSSFGYHPGGVIAAAAADHYSSARASFVEEARAALLAAGWVETDPEKGLWREP